LPLENLRLRTVEALRALGVAQHIAVPSELKVGPLCDALLAVRDLLQCHGDKHSLVPGEHQEPNNLAVLRIFASEMHGLISALEIVSARSQAIVELNDAKAAHGHKEGQAPTSDNDAR
jgi:hypothetical protein